MADEPIDQPDDIQGILSDLNDILAGLGDNHRRAVVGPPPLKPVEPPKPAEPPKPIEPPKPVELPKPVEFAKPAEPPEPVGPPMPVEPPKPVEFAKPVEPPKPAPAADEALKIDLAPRAGFIPPAPKPEPAKPAPQSPPPPPEPAAVPEAAPVDDIPASASKEQIRRIAYVYTSSCAEARASLATYLSQAARTISKKPIYLRQVMTAELSPTSDPFAVFEKARNAKAVAVLAVVEGWPPAKIDGLSEACARGGLLFRTVAPADVLKKSTAVDVIVDMMLLGGEA